MADTYHEPGRRLSLILEKTEMLRSPCSSYAGGENQKHATTFTQFESAECRSPSAGMTLSFSRQEKRVVFVTFVRELPSLITQQSEHTEGHMPRCTVDV